MINQELLDIVNKNDKVVGEEKKAAKLSKGLISRNVGVFIMDEQQRLLIAKRSKDKKSFPGRLDLSACGNVKKGETYDSAARREVKEELGIDCNLEFLDKIYNEFNEDRRPIRYFTGLFLGRHNGKVRLNEELTEAKRLSIQEIERMLSRNKESFCPGFVNDFLHIKDRLKY